MRLGRGERRVRPRTPALPSPVPAPLAPARPEDAGHFSVDPNFTFRKCSRSLLKECIPGPLPSATPHRGRGALTAMLSHVPSRSSPRNNLGWRVPWGLVSRLDRTVGLPACSPSRRLRVRPDSRAPLRASIEDQPSNVLAQRLSRRRGTHAQGEPGGVSGGRGRRGASPRGGPRRPCALLRSQSASTGRRD